MLPPGSVASRKCARGVNAWPRPALDRLLVFSAGLVGARPVSFASATVAFAAAPGGSRIHFFGQSQLKKPVVLRDLQPKPTIQLSKILSADDQLLPFLAAQ